MLVKHTDSVTIQIAILPVPGYCKTFKSHIPLILEVFFQPFQTPLK